LGKDAEYQDLVKQTQPGLVKTADTRQLVRVDIIHNCTDPEDAQSKMASSAPVRYRTVRKEVNKSAVSRTSTLLMLMYLNDTSVIAKSRTSIEDKIRESLFVLQNQEKDKNSEKNVWLNMKQERLQA
jgi:hypothetical protein